MLSKHLYLLLSLVAVAGENSGKRSSRQIFPSIRFPAKSNAGGLSVVLEVEPDLKCTYTWNRKIRIRVAVSIEEEFAWRRQP